MASPDFLTYSFWEEFTETEERLLFAQIKKLLTQPVQSTLLQVPRALAASCLVACLDFAVLVTLVEQVHWQAVPAAIVSYLAGGVLQYVLCANWVFPAAPGNNAIGFVTFTALSLVGLGITWLTMTIVHDLGHFNYALAKLISLGFSFTWNFSSRKLLLFKSSPKNA